MKTYWSYKRRAFQPNEKIDAFLAEIEAVCRKHGLSISHEDDHGAFVIEPFAQAHVEWLQGAHDNVDPSDLMG